MRGLKGDERDKISEWSEMGVRSEVFYKNESSREMEEVKRFRVANVSEV